MKKLLLLLLLISIYSAEAKETKKNNPYIKGFGWGLCGDFGSIRSYAKYNPDKYDYIGSTQVHDTVYVKKSTPVGLSILYFGWNSHFILNEINENKSISLNVYPTVGLGFTKSRLLNISVPLMLCYNMGNVATYSAKKDAGITLGIGVEYIKAGLVKVVDEKNDLMDDDGSIGYNSKTSGFIQPCAAFGIRYFTRGGHAQELNLKFGLRPSGKTYDAYGEMPASEKKSSINFWCRLSHVFYIRY